MPTQPGWQKFLCRYPTGGIKEDKRPAVREQNLLKKSQSSSAGKKGGKSHCCSTTMETIKKDDRPVHLNGRPVVVLLAVAVRPVVVVALASGLSACCHTATTAVEWMEIEMMMMKMMMMMMPDKNLPTRLATVASLVQ